MNKKILLSAFLLTGLTACGAGSGSGLDSNGQPVIPTPEATPTPPSGVTPTPEVTPTPDPGATPTPDPNQVTLEKIQEEIFASKCVSCHQGANASGGLPLDSAEISYANLVNKDADRYVGEVLVIPGDAENSLLVKKIEGQPAAGAQMPLNLTPLSQGEIDDIRAWIDAGAAQPTSAVTSTKVTTASHKLTKQAFELTLEFGRELDASVISNEDVLVERQYKDFKKVEVASSVKVEGMSMRVTSLRDTTLPAPTSIKIILNDPSTAPIQDAAGRYIDGNNDQVDGGQFSYVYVIQ